MRTSYRNLGEFIAALGKAGELRVVEEPVSTYLEISKFTDSESKSPEGGKALFFNRVKGSVFPVATNLFGSPRRICMALGVRHLDELGARIRDLLEMSPPRNLRDLLGLLPRALSVSRFFPRRTRAQAAPCQQVVHTGDAVDLSRLPVLHCWPKDAGPFVTLPLVFTRSLSTGRRNVGMYRLQVFDRNTTGMHWHVHKDGSHYYREYCAAGRRMPVAVAIGADPATIYAATAPLPRHADEMILAGFIRNRPVAMTRCITSDMEVPAEAEFVLEGYVEPGEQRLEGPFGDHTGYYSLPDYYPVFHVTALTHRKNPVYCATLVGRPPMEDCYLAKATERLFLPLLQMVFPEIRDYWLPWEGVFHNIVVVAVNKEYAGHGHKVMHGLWGQGQMSYCKAIVVVDGRVDVQDPVQVLEQVMEKLDVSSDLTLARGILDVLDHSSPIPNYGAKVGIDLTARMAGEPPRQPASDSAAATPPRLEDLLARIQGRCEGVIKAGWFPPPSSPKPSWSNRLLFLAVAKDESRTGRYFAERLLAAAEVQAFSIILLYDFQVDLEDASLLLWKMFNNVDPGRDLFVRGHRVVVDACKKTPGDGHPREWPDELSFE
jgi:4-hydroxy-3-polyprenylbenzoate decarboxylase